MAPKNVLKKKLKKKNSFSPALFSFIWVVKNFHHLYVKDDYSPLSCLFSPPFSAPFDHRWKFNVCLHQNGLSNKNYLALSLHAYEGPPNENDKIWITASVEVKLINQQGWKTRFSFRGNLTLNGAIIIDLFLKNGYKEMSDYLTKKDELTIKIIFLKMGKYKPEINNNAINVKTPVICRKSNAKVSIIKLSCEAIINNFEETRKNKTDIFLKHKFEQQNNDLIIYMYIWPNGKWKCFENYVSVAFETHKTKRKYQNVNAKVFICSNNTYYCTKVFCGVFSRFQKTQFGCDCFVLAKTLLDNVDDYLDKNSLKIISELELISPYKEAFENNSSENFVFKKYIKAEVIENKFVTNLINNVINTGHNMNINGNITMNFSTN